MQQLLPTVQFDRQLLQKYDRPVPRYTSYPPATELKPEFNVIDFRAGIAVSNYKKTPLSLYCHIPFCDTPCYFCGCNTVITQRREFAETYLGYLIRHIQQMAQLIDQQRTVQQMHWGGGTPNYLSLSQIETLWAAIQEHFRFDPNAEISIEVNPKSLDRNYLFALRDLGFNRISFGIQDFDLNVQEAVNRVQPESMLFDVMEWTRDAGFESVNVDLIYGLPFQTLETFRKTIRKTIQLNPDRIAKFNFAYVPWMKPVQRRIPEQALPSPAEKLSIVQMAIEELTEHGYQYIGMDHFAKPNDELAIAQREGQLHRNFQGYTTKPESDLIGFGVTSISMLNDVYVQNHKRLKDFYQVVDANELPIERGVTLDQDDIIRRTVIMELMCQFQLSPDDIEQKYHLGFDLDFDTYFAHEQFQLRLLEADGLVKLSRNHIKVTPAGRLLIRNIASTFDAYLRRNTKSSFSRAV
ncbi:oxygen-independent coproporphyrinogen III oxidase [Aetokthonos hydrillicola Thurmond2011]|jgi:oxygen-independent coproporphyrinogen-3 oxidase|uniref:Coproporphyrinogen-III oxidase n=1 Tax=Aetokthonos hydrillicola Thurmond2011 TaxID=2712845 RepID=A0AAP5MBJ8_9CYAN|nr:oxygen-independent coproporphyrinogen III oxidase [Aetokthonos hydrillicola]MBO3457989.1 oxygen-independent coproporphyrinogen III oxidase [Aetokthonos hydrillicola CCALA 1050]MBW4587177.1 oxygen-independent coproporphyrinogen III oxidase [Aetokthonos hydrillicola CCALA 1050]MDR9899345.1 oxygen-independent coproporphyrinogen III oxidase [Aetokthonos hydrillicola Thurmond2011]